MIHYHGAPLGGPTRDIGEFFVGRHALVSHEYPKQLGLIADVCQSFVLDNGAFSAWRKNQGENKKEWNPYYKWVDSWRHHPGFDWALIPDVIGGTEEENDRLLEEWPFGFVGVPVWHLHESLDRLDRLVATWRIVALGSSGEYSQPNSHQWRVRMRQAMRVCCTEAGLPRTWLHGLRMLNPKVFSKLPLKSADSANAAINAGSKKRFGQYMPPTAAQRANVIANRIEQFSSSPIWDPTTWESSLKKVSASV